MYNPVLLEMLAHEKQRQIEQEFRDRQTLKAIGREPPSIFRWLRSRTSGNSRRQLNKNLQGTD